MRTRLNIEELQLVYVRGMGVTDEELGAAVSRVMNNFRGEIEKHLPELMNQVTTKVKQETTGLDITINIHLNKEDVNKLIQMIMMFMFDVGSHNGLNKDINTIMGSFFKKIEKVD